MFDFSLVLGVRLGDHNPWLIDRLQRLGTHYDALPPVVVADLGSGEEHAQTIAGVCRRFGFRHVRIEDGGTFSLSRARNCGALAAETPLILFTDVDFFFAPGDLVRIQQLVDDLGLVSRIDTLLDFPAYHLSERSTAAFLDCPSPRAFLNRLGFDGLYEAFGGRLDFVAPYSNVFLVHRQLFDMAGGYDEGFRGHGSEDFEFLTRLALVAGIHPMPQAAESNDYGPRTAAFFGARPYRGHRRLLEAMAQPAEFAGLRAFHLWHPVAEGGDWRRLGDRSGQGLDTALARYLGDRSRLLDADHLARGKRALCLCRDAEDRGFFLPFRLLDYALTAVTPADADRIAAHETSIRAGEVDALLAVAPPAGEAAAFGALLDAARRTDVEVVVVEPGPVPGSVRYVSEGDGEPDDPGGEALRTARFSDEELQRAALSLADAAARSQGDATPKAGNPTEATPPLPADDLRLRAWQLRRSSFFVADDASDAASAAGSLRARNVAVTRLRWKHHDLRLARQREETTFSARSYGRARLGIAEDGARRDGIGMALERLIVRSFWSRRQYQKYLADRRAFFEGGSDSLFSRLCTLYVRRF